MTYDGYGRTRRADVWPVRLLRGLSGVAAGGVVVLTAVVVGVAWLASDRDFPGPGSTSIAAHVTASVVVVALQMFADRRRGAAPALSSVAILAVTGLLLWTQWWT